MNPDNYSLLAFVKYFKFQSQTKNLNIHVVAFSKESFSQYPTVSVLFYFNCQTLHKSVGV